MRITLKLAKRHHLHKHTVKFQEYIKLHKQIGVLLTVNSKNDEANAVSGFERPDSVLKRDDFISFKANWNAKSINIMETAKELALLPESFCICR